jgi:hypothetical protein
MPLADGKHPRLAIGGSAATRPQCVSICPFRCPLGHQARRQIATSWDQESIFQLAVWVADEADARAALAHRVRWALRLESLPGQPLVRPIEILDADGDVPIGESATIVRSGVPERDQAVTCSSALFEQGSVRPARPFHRGNDATVESLQAPAAGRTAERDFEFPAFLWRAVGERTSRMAGPVRLPRLAGARLELLARRAIRRSHADHPDVPKARPAPAAPSPAATSPAASDADVCAPACTSAASGARAAPSRAGCHAEAGAGAQEAPCPAACPTAAEDEPDAEGAPCGPEHLAPASRQTRADSSTIGHPPG